MHNGVVTDNVMDTKISHNMGSKLLDNVTFNNSDTIHIKSLKTKKLIWVRQDIHKNPENKLTFHKFSTKLHM